MSDTSSTQNFKFYLINSAGGSVGFKRLDGAIDGNGITLDGNFIPYINVHSTATFEKRIVIKTEGAIALEGKVAKHKQAGDFITIECNTANSANVLKRKLDQYSSLVYAKARQAKLESEGKGDTFKIAQCTGCKSTIELTGFKESAMIYCNFCGNIQDKSGTTLTDGKQYAICSNSGLFDRIQTYTEFYFYFLLVVYGWRNKEVRAGDFWAGSKLFPKTFFINFLFILGIIPSLYIKYKSLTGRNPQLADLAKMNKLAYNGKIAQVNQIVERLDAEYRNHPGILYNVAVAAQKASQDQLKTDAINKALATCSNYMPALRLLLAKK